MFQVALKELHLDVWFLMPHYKNQTMSMSSHSKLQPTGYNGHHPTSLYRQVGHFSETSSIFATRRIILFSPYWYCYFKSFKQSKTSLLSALPNSSSSVSYVKPKVKNKGPAKYAVLHRDVYPRVPDTLQRRGYSKGGSPTSSFWGCKKMQQGTSPS